MSRAKPNPAQPDLFGPPPPRKRDLSPIELPMVEVSKGTDDAWHLKPAGVSSGKAAWAPRTLVKAVEGRSGVFTMPHWMAAERGWL